MFACILNDKNKICFIDFFDKKQKIYYTLCGHCYNKNTQNIISIDSSINLNCKHCLLTYYEIYGKVEDILSRNFSQQKMILFQENYKHYNKCDQYLRKYKRRK